MFYLLALLTLNSIVYLECFYFVLWLCDLFFFIIHFIYLLFLQGA